ncbi:MAG: type II and III secretion system protein family protein, partial [Planctomycetota bacterium]
QVQLQVTVAEVDRSAGRSIGLNFNIFNSGGLQVASSTTGQIRPALGLGIGNSFTSFTSNGGLGNVVPQGVLNNLPVALDNGQIQLAINALRELHYAKTLAEPALVAMNGQSANFQAGGLLPLPYVTGYTNYGLQGVNFMPIGVQLNFTPYILGRDRLRLQVSAEVSERDLTLGSTVINGSAVPALSTRNFQTTVELQEGQTLAVAGLLQNRAAGNSSRTPFLADIPIVNRLTGIDRVQSSEQELVILVTPRLVGALDPDKVGPLPGNDLFEPNNIEFYLLGRIESRRNKDFRAPVMTDMHRRLNYLKCQEFYMNGPTGHAASAPLVEE